MPKKKDIWTQITKSLQSSLKKSEFKTWFSQTTLKKLDNKSANIGVPNKFVANWIHDNYFIEIRKSFEKILKKSLHIHFSYDPPSIRQGSSEPQKIKKIEQYQGHNLNPSMTFDRFITGDCNKFACSSAIEVANRPAHHYNPLYLFCNSGLGKTHLLHAIGNHVLTKNPFSRIKYLSSDTFTSDFIYSMKNKNTQKLRQKYSNLDLLLFDDVQLLNNREKTQEEFLFIFDSLFGEKKQIVVTSNRPPDKLMRTNPQLKSRLGWGLLTEIQWPDHKTKIDIIKRKAFEDNINIPDDVGFFLASSNSDIKTLIKNIVRIEAYASLNNGDINISAVKSLIKDIHKPDIGMEDIKAMTAGYFHISVSDLISNKKKRVYSYPRQMAMYLARKFTNASFKEIGDSFGPKDHSTVIYAIRRIERFKDQKKGIMDDLKKIENLLT